MGKKISPENEAINGLMAAVQKRNPDASPREVKKITNNILSFTARSLGQNGGILLVGPEDKDGNRNARILTVEIKERKPQA